MGTLVMGVTPMCEGWSGLFEPEMECAVGWRVATARPVRGTPRKVQSAPSSRLPRPAHSHSFAHVLAMTATPISNFSPGSLALLL
jgi:hypothetical protein